MQVAGMKFVDDAAIGLIENGILAVDRPVSHKAPLIEAGITGRINMPRVLDRPERQNFRCAAETADRCERGGGFAVSGCAKRVMGELLFQPKVKA
jgi:hypothetical protein